MPRDFKLCLLDILDSLETIATYVQGMSYADFSSDRKTRDAVIRNLEVIGEAAKGIPEEIRAGSSAVSWQRIAGLRDILIHQYFAVDLEIIWDIVTQKMPWLKDQVHSMLKNYQD